MTYPGNSHDNLNSDVSIQFKAYIPKTPDMIENLVYKPAKLPIYNVEQYKPLFTLRGVKPSSSHGNPNIIAGFTSFDYIPAPGKTTMHEKLEYLADHLIFLGVPNYKLDFSSGKASPTTLGKVTMIGVVSMINNSKKIWPVFCNLGWKLMTEESNNDRNSPSVEPLEIYKNQKSDAELLKAKISGKMNATSDTRKQLALEKISQLMFKFKTKGDLLDTEYFDLIESISKLSRQRNFIGISLGLVKPGQYGDVLIGSAPH